MKDLTRRLSKIMILLLFTTTANCYAQFSGGLQGTVEDSTRAAVSNAKVTLLNQDTQVSLQATSDAAGVYRFVSLAPGSSVVFAYTSGFGTAAASFTLTAAETRNVPIKLTVGTVSTFRLTTRALINYRLSLNSQQTVFERLI
jgi:hypothetical protein